MRVFTDTNILVSSLAFGGFSGRLVDLLLEKHEVFVSPQVLSELKRNMVVKFDWEAGEVDSFIRDFLTVANLVSPPFERKFPVRDPDDIDILAAAVKSNSDVLVTGDKDLLEVVDPPIPIMTPRALYDLLFANE